MEDTLKQLLILLKTPALWVGVIIGIIVGFWPSVYAGHLGNLYTEKKKKKTLEGKQKQFIDGLSAVTQPFITTLPANEDEVLTRRTTVAAEVKKLSREIFKQDYPEIISIRPENTEYPELSCKWCHRNHKAFAGSKGDCTNCNLPLDFWIGCQGETHKSSLH